MHRSFRKVMAAALLAVGLLLPGRGEPQPSKEDFLKEFMRRVEEKRADDGDITLSHQFRQGKILMGEYRAIIEMQLTDGNKRTDKVEDVFFSILIKDVSKNETGGAWTAKPLEVTILRVKVRDQEGANRYYDSNVPADLSRQELKRWSTILYRPFRCWMQYFYSYTITNIDTSPPGELSVQMEEEIRKILKLVFIYLPPRPVKRGGVCQALTKKINVDAIGSVSFSINYGFTAEPGKTGVEEIRVTGSLDQADGIQVESSSYTGHVMFDVQKGHVTRAEDETSIAFTYKPAPRINMRMKMKTEYTLSRVKDS